MQVQLVENGKLGKWLSLVYWIGGFWSSQVPPGLCFMITFMYNAGRNRGNFLALKPEFGCGICWSLTLNE